MKTFQKHAFFLLCLLSFISFVFISTQYSPGAEQVVEVSDEILEAQIRFVQGDLIVKLLRYLVVGILA